MWHGVRGGIKTGYGNQTALFTRTLLDEGHQMAIAGVCDQYQTEIDENGITNYPCIKFPGNEYINGHFAEFQPDIVLSMMDAWAVDGDKFAKVNWVPWVMIDSEPLLPEMARKLKVAKHILAPTDTAMRVLSDAGFENVSYVPLAIDTKVYKQMDRTRARALLAKAWPVAVGDRFLAVMVAANFSRPSRKNFAGAFKAFAAHLQKHPNSLLYVHTMVDGSVTCGVDLDATVNLYGLEPGKNILFAPQYSYACGTIGADYLNAVYNAADAYLCTSHGEGFGLPIIEAQSAGCPVIVPAFGAMQDLCYSGITCGGMRFEYHPGTEQFMVAPEDVADALDTCAVGSAESREITSARVQHYDIETVMKNDLVPALKRIAAKLGIQYREDSE
jgi:glycosyltransferase involved in cell wall biosynthesis